MKKIYSISLAALLALSFVSCKDSKDDKDKKDPAPIVIVAENAKFIGTYAGTMTCSQGSNSGGNLQIVAGPSSNQIDVVGAGIATVNGNSFTIPDKTTSQSGYSQTVGYSGTLNGNVLTFTNKATVSVMGTTSSTTCTGNLVKQ